MQRVSICIGVLSLVASTIVVAQESAPSDIAANPSVEPKEISISREEMARRGIVTVADLVRELKALENIAPGDGFRIRIQDSSEAVDVTEPEVDGQASTASDQ